MEAVKKQSRSLDDGKNGSSGEIKSLGEEIVNLKTKIKNLESQCEAKTKEANAAKAELDAKRK